MRWRERRTRNVCIVVRPRKPELHNLTEAQRAYLIGKLANSLKAEVGKQTNRRNQYMGVEVDQIDTAQPLQRGSTKFHHWTPSNGDKPTPQSSLSGLVLCTSVHYGLRVRYPPVHASRVQLGHNYRVAFIVPLWVARRLHIYICSRSPSPLRPRPRGPDPPRFSIHFIPFFPAFFLDPHGRPANN